MFFAEYGSMLSSPSSDGHIKSSFDNANSTNQLNTKYETSETGTTLSMTENVMFTARNTVLDMDMHWEMNYHKAAIFLEVIVSVTHPTSLIIMSISMCVHIYIYKTRRYN